MEFLNLFKKKPNADPLHDNRDLILLINANAEGKELPKNIVPAEAYRKAKLLMPVIAGSDAIFYDDHGVPRVNKDAPVSMPLVSIDGWNVYTAFLEPEAIQQRKYPSLTRFMTVPFNLLDSLLSRGESDGWAIYIFTNEASAGLTEEQIQRINRDPKLTDFRPIGLLEAQENYRDINYALNTSPAIRQKLCQKLKTMPEVSAAWFGHMVDRGTPKYFILFDGKGSTKPFFQEVEEVLKPELNGKDLVHIRYFDGFSTWITANIPQFYDFKEPDRCGWFIEEKPDTAPRHIKEFRKAYKKRRKD